MGAQNIRAGSAGRRFKEFRNDYLLWVQTATATLRNTFDDPSVWSGLHSEYFWRIRDLTAEQPRAFELIAEEAERQGDRIEVLRARVLAFAEFAASHAGCLAVLDTHVLLHFLPVDQVDWRAVVGQPSVHLILPLRVVEEVDEKKYTGSDVVRPRARSVVQMLRKVLAPGHGGPVEIREDISLEVLLDDEPRRRPADADQEILDSARELAGAGLGVRLVTDDAGMELRAGALGLQVVRMPDKYLRRRDSPSD